jgi:long-chain acyl-CoA synthetase
MNLALRFAETAGRLPSKVAVFDDAGQHTFDGLLAAATALAARVRTETARENVGILAPTSAAFPVAYFGTLLADKAAVPLNPRLDAKALSFFVRDAGLDTIVGCRPFAGLMEALGTKAIFVEHAHEPPREPMAPTRSDGDCATLLYTTGTTGVPKGVVLTHRNLFRNVEACNEHIGITEDYVLLGVLPLFHSFGLTTSMLVPLLGGCSVVYLARFSAQRVFEAIARHRVMCCFAVASMYGDLVRAGAPIAGNRAPFRAATVRERPHGHLLTRVAPGLDLSSVRILVSGGEPLRMPLPARIEELFGVPLLGGYGLTETSPVVAVNQPGGCRAGSAGRLLPWVEARVVDDQGRPVPSGEVGELRLRGDCVTPGYHNRPQETAAAFTPDGWFRTGDLARLDADGYLWLVGRKKDIIIRGGEKISPDEVEAVLCEHPAIAEAAVIGIPDELRGEVPKAFVVLREGAAADAADLMAFCRERLPRYKLPAALEVRPQLPRTPTGKVNKLALREQEAAHVAPGGSPGA